LSGYEIAFTIMAIIAAIGGILVVTSRNVVRSALSLVAVLGSIGALFILFGAEFLGWTQVLIYVGAIVVLLLFGIMLTKAPIGRVALDNQQRLIAAVVALLIFGTLTFLIWRAFGDEHIALSPDKITRTSDIGKSVFTGFVLPFEAISVLLLAALVGAIVIARRDR
jgi:NADH-quinone oxidoreductase subunit J